MPKWLPPNGFTCAVHHLDARVGGTYKMSFTNFSTGHAHSFGGDYLELAPNERIRHTDRFDKKKVVQNKKKIGSTFKRYSGEASPFTLGPERFPSLQSNLLAALESDLRLLAVRFAK